MVVALFKEGRAASSFFKAYAPDTRIIRFWLHEPTRLTDGHVAVTPDGKAQVRVNLSSCATVADIAVRAEMDGAMWRDQAGFDAWNDTQVADLLQVMQVTTDSADPTRAFADAVVAPIRAAEHAAGDRLSILWDVDERNVPDAIGLRYQVVQKAEAILNDAGLLVDPQGTVVADDTVAATLNVTEFGAAKSLLWNVLSPEERRYNCRIQHG